MNPALRALALAGRGMLAVLALHTPTLGSPAGAAPRVDVTATATIEIQSVEPIGTQGFRLVGQVTDAASREPMGALPLAGRVDDRAVRTQTDSHGRFVIDLMAEAPPQRIELQLAEHRYVRAMPLRLDQPVINRPVPLLSIDAALGRDSFRVDVRRQTATSDAADPGVAFDRPIDLVASQGDTSIALAAALVGGGEFAIASLPSRGTWALTASYAGDERFAPASATTTLTLAARGAITLTLAAAQVAADETLVARGKLSRADGELSAPAAVVLMTGEQRLATAQTAADGSFELRLPATSLPLGRHGLFAALDTPIAGVEVAPSPLRWLTIAAVGAPSRLGAALGIALGGLALIAVLWLQRRWRRQQRPAPIIIHRPGFAPARPSVMQRMLRADRREVAVVVYDAASRRPLAGTVTAMPSSPAGRAPQEARTSVAGSAHLELADGSYELTVSCPGYRPVATAISIPHRGQWAQRAVYLVSLRDEMFELYAAAVEPFIDLSPHVASPASIFDHVRRKLALTPMSERDMYAPIKALTEQIETLYFGDREIGVANIAAIAQLTAQLRPPRSATSVAATRGGLR